jgi:hypothetical protein
MHCTASTRRFLVVRTILALLAMPALAAPAGAAEPAERPLSEEQQARVEARIEEVRQRLELSDEQRAGVESLLRRDFERRVEVLQRHGITREADERPSGQVMRAARRDLKAVREQTDAELERILDDRQFEEYLEMRQEAQEDMHERLRSRSTDKQ